MTDVPSTDVIDSMIRTIRGQRVILDEDMAQLYGVETKPLLQSIRRNLARFPDDFMFRLTQDEFDGLWTTLGRGGKRGGRRTCPFLCYPRLMPSFAVIDFETTGFSPARGDRVVEVGIVLLGRDGVREGEWDTLLNPMRDVGASWVHGITDDDVQQAPEFGDVAGVLSELLAGRVLVAHNLAFDARFLDGEYRRLGHELGVGSGSGLCTMRLAQRYAPGPKDTLEACCERCGVEQRAAHSALDDARACGELLRHYLGREREPEDAWADAIRASLAIEWPRAGGRGWRLSRAG